MTQDGDIAGESIRAAYRDYDCRLRARYMIVGNIVGLICMPAGVLLDFFVYPEKVPLFLAIRLGVSFILLLILLAIVLGRDKLKYPLIVGLGLLTPLVINLSFCLMIYFTQGARSPYYAGISLIITGMATLMPWRVFETVFVCAVSFVFYVGACLANPLYPIAESFSNFASNSFFITLTAAICVTSTFLLSRARFEDFRLRHQLDFQNKELQDLDRLKTRFFSNISHELRTPLTLILGPVENLLSRGESLEPKVHESLLLIHRNTLRLLKLINDLLDLTRLDQGGEILRKKEIPLESFVKGIVESVRHLGLAKQLRMRVKDGCVEDIAVADPARLEKVLLNLLTNAIKYTPTGGTITAGWENSATETTIEVADTGVGIPAEDLPRIFDRFHQVRSNAANQTQGVGIGLSLAKELVEHHGGTLEVESQVGVGTTFRIRLPLTAESRVEDAPAAEPVAAIEEPFEKAFRSADRSWRSYNENADVALPQLGRGKDVVLVADDEPDMRHYIVSILAEDHRVIQTQHGGNVSALVAEHDPALVLLDWMMPAKDGLQVCRELRADARHRDLKIVLLTARIDEKSKLDALQSGADDFLTKPFSSVEVKTRVANLLRAAHLQRDLRARNEELSATVEKLQHTEWMLIQSEKMNAIGSLSAGLLHEINNPLNYTLTAISLVNRHRDSLNAEMRELLADIEEGMVRIRDVITNLKNFAYPEKADHKSIFPLAEALRDAQKLSARELLDVRVDAQLSDDVIVRGQKTQLTHLFINLLANAAKAFEENPVMGPKIITVRAALEDEMATIEVADNGPGIPPEIIHRVFEPFFTTRQVGSGMGMGLSICHTIMEAHEGSIRVGHRSGGGAVFTIHIPLADPALKSC